MTTPTPDGSNAAPPFAVLAARYCDPDDEPDVTTIDFDTARVTGNDPGRILAYLTSLGLPPPQTLVELHDTINAIPDEEELHAWMVVEGVAVSIASDNTWFVFTEAAP